MTEIASIAPGKANAAVTAGVWNLLVEVDEEFVPPLSRRRDTVALTPASQGVTAGSPRQYADALRQEHLLVATAHGGVVAVLSFVRHEDDPVLHCWSPSLHVTTLMVRRAHRRHGLACALYTALEKHAVGGGVPYLTTRTWGTNDAHIRLLDHLGFHPVARLPDHRGDGEPTVYFAVSCGAAGP